MSDTAEWSLEPADVVRWITYLHQREDHKIAYLLGAIRNTKDIPSDTLNHESNTRRPRWEDYEGSDLPCVLMDIVSEPDMFFGEPVAFKSVSYSLGILSLLFDFLSTLVCRISQDPGSNQDSVRGLISRMDGFCKAMWSNRHFIPTTSESSSQHDGSTGCDFAVLSTGAIVHMARIYSSKKAQLGVPLSAYAIHFLLYSWTYVPREDTTLHMLPTLGWVFQCTDIDGTADYMGKFVASGHGRYTDDALRKSNGLLRDEEVLNESAFWISGVCLGIVQCHHTTAETLVALVSNLMLCCQRQMCSSMAMHAEQTVQMLSHILMRAMRSGSNASPELHEITSKTFVLGILNVNLIAILGYTLRVNLADALSPAFASTQILLRSLHEVAKKAVRYRDHILVEHLRHTGVRIWYDTLKFILAFKTNKDPSGSMRKEALEVWQEYGKVFGWKAGDRVTSVADQPSVPSNESPYWKIPKRCFSNACACSAHAASHRMRVCKGCFRVLYCSRLCQQSDWITGHRLNCKPLVGK